MKNMLSIILDGNLIRVEADGATKNELANSVYTAMSLLYESSSPLFEAIVCGVQNCINDIETGELTKSKYTNGNA